ncbi:phosphotransferase family protein [Phenylobacterium sp.]|uniref:phosphotransferase family protein n=1 Tax=Phenylobacterium sp. TaxID=1871053 RepID=UPI002727D997|nr:aminoglycoside phosphotransferase family protein [Phenylobacterium sp.]MDO8378874.1 aminoglycoside phosphotransferase family protein [Phenylobacterium sp.]
MSDQALKHFGVTAADLLGSGVQSRAYALGEGGVLRVFSDKTTLAHVQALEAFYRRLDSQAAPFQIPRFDEVREIAGSACVVEARIPGIELTRFLETAAPSARQRALSSYMAAAGQIQLIGFDAPYHGQILGAAPVRAETWPDYLSGRAQASLDQAPWARADLIQPARALERLHHLAQSRADAPRRLAHGDYHPGNVLVDDEGQVTGVIDFSVQAVMGDPLLDLTSAAFFFDDKADRAYAASQAHSLSADLFAQASELYWLYYSFFYLSAKAAKPALYDLCVRSLNAAAEA